MQCNCVGNYEKLGDTVGKTLNFGSWSKLTFSILLTVIPLISFVGFSAKAFTFNSNYLYAFDLPKTPCDRLYSPMPGHTVCEMVIDNRLIIAEVQVTSNFSIDFGITSNTDIASQKYWDQRVKELEIEALRNPPRGATVVKSLIGKASSSIRDSKSCIRYRQDTRYRTKYIDNEGMRCLFYDPRNRVVDMVVVQYQEVRTSKHRHPSFSDEASEMVKTLKRVPK